MIENSIIMGGLEYFQQYSEELAARSECFFRCFAATRMWSGCWYGDE